MKAVLLFLALVAPPPALQFDLVCTGRWRLESLGQYQPHDFRLRVDLAQRLWCQGDCTVLNPIVNVQPAKLVFRRSSATEEALGVNELAQVDRATGEYMHIRVDRRPGVIDVKASCSPSPFSGFPEIRRKF